MDEVKFDNKPKPIIVDIENKFPFNHLGELSKVIGSVEVISQVPLEMAVQSALSIIALSSQKHILINGLADQIYPTSQFHITIAESGDRKSSVDKKFMKGVNEIEIELENNIQIETNDRKVEEFYTPSLIIRTGTWEGIFNELKHNHSLGLFSDEGGMFVGGYGMNKDNIRKMLSGLISLFDGTMISKTTKGDETTKLRNRNLSIHLMMQPVIINIFRDAQVRDQGFLPRCLVSMPKPKERRYINDELDLVTLEESVTEYNNKIKERLRNPWFEKKIITYDTHIRNKFVDYHNNIEDLTATGGDLYNLKAYARRSVEHAFRIATNFMWYRDYNSTHLSIDDADNGIELSKYYLRETERLLHLNAVNHNEQKADKLSKWMNKKDDKFFTRRRILNGYRITARELNPLINILLDHNHIREVDDVVRGEKYEYLL